MRIKFELDSIRSIVRRHGLDSGGAVQRFHTSNVLRRIIRYMPYRSGMTIKITQLQTNVSQPLIITDTPYAKYLYYGKMMVGKAPKVLTDKPLEYTLDKNPLAGPFWDRRLAANEGDVIAQELQAYIDRLAARQRVD